MNTFKNSAVAEVFDTYPAPLRKRLLSLRRLIFDVASKTEGVGRIDETLRWGEPAYVTAESGSGSTIRIDRKKNCAGKYAMYFHCQTTLVDTFRTLFPKTFKFEGNRSIVFDVTDRVRAKELSLCIRMALTYRLDRRW